jgi:DNA primase
MTGILTLFEDFSISYAKTNSDWVNVERCPFCYDQKFHLGYNLSNNYFNCWKCGGHSTYDTLMLLLGLSYFEVRNLLSDYSVGDFVHKQKRTKPSLAKTMELPRGCGPLKESHKRYLINRGFNPDKISYIWRLQAAPHYGVYKYRIVAPIYHDDVLVSYQTRDITGKAELRYLSASKDKELRPHKECLYGIDLVPRRKVIVVEGITDAWRLGAGAVATFGIEWTNPQLLLLKRFKEVFIIYDTSLHAQAQAQKLASAVAAFNIECSVVHLDDKYKDPAELPEREAEALKFYLGVYE